MVEEFYIDILKYIAEIIVFLILMIIFEYVYKKVNLGSYRIFNPREYFPKEEIHSLKQISFLIMMGLCFVDILYAIVFNGSDVPFFVAFDILLSLYLAIELDKSSIKGKIILLLLIPYGSLTYVIFGHTLVGLMNLIHVPAYFYFIKLYYDKFRQYTQSNGLGLSIILLFAIIFISFFITQVSEHVNPLDALVMVSNSFTSNGYAVLGSSVPGKINSIFLVWSGYLLSGVGTATLTAGILINHYKKKLREINDKLNAIEELLKKND